MEASHQVLAGLQVDAGLAPNRRIDLREQSCRHLNIVDAAHKDRREESAQVANDPAAKGDQQRRAIGVALGQLFGKTLDVAQPLVFFAGMQEEHRRWVVMGEGFKKRISPQRPDFRRREHEDPLILAARDLWNSPTEARKQVSSYKNGIVRAAGLYLNRPHTGFIVSHSQHRD